MIVSISSNNNFLHTISFNLGICLIALYGLQLINFAILKAKNFKGFYTFKTFITILIYLHIYTFLYILLHIYESFDTFLFEGCLVWRIYQRFFQCQIYLRSIFQWCLILNPQFFCKIPVFQLFKIITVSSYMH